MTRDELLEAFFGDGNGIDLAQVEQTPRLRALVDDLDERLARPAVLPRRTGPDEVEWFVLCGSETALRRAQVELQGFVGPTYARWEGPRARLDAADPVEQAVDAFCDGRAIRFRTKGEEERRACMGAIELMRAVWNQRPAERPERVRTGAAQLRELELALAAGDTASADRLVADLRRRGLIGAENLRFLEIRGLAARGRWGALASAPDLPDLARIRRPWLVTEDLVTALYRVRLAPCEHAGDTAGALREAAALADELPRLFTVRGPLRSPDVVKAFALVAAAGAAPARVEELRTLPSLPAEAVAWIDAVAAAGEPPPAPPRDVHEALRAGDREAAFALALAEAPSAARAEVLLECAFELQTLAAAREAVAALDALPAAEQAELLERRLLAHATARLRELVEPSAVATAEAAPRNWRAWFERLLADADWGAAEAVAACGELEYEGEDLRDAQTAEELGRLVLAAAESPRRRAFRDALPKLVGWLERQQEAALAQPIHVALLTVLALDEAWGSASLEVAYNATDALLREGLDADGYAELLAQLTLLWERMASRAHVAWLADLLELLELHPGPREPLAGFVAAALAPVGAFADRVDPSVAAAVALSCEAIGAPEAAASLARAAGGRRRPASAAPADALAGRLVGIYTLTPQVALRAREAIERRFPGVRVEVDESLVETPALAQLAARADYLIVSVRSAKHAATAAIDRHRPPRLPTIVPRGRGSTRMLEALVAAVEEGA